MVRVLPLLGCLPPLAWLALALGLGAWSGCAPTLPPARGVAARSRTPSDLRHLFDRIYWEHFAARPHEGAHLGYHHLDGKLPDVRPRALKREIQRLERRRRQLVQVSPRLLDQRLGAERDVLLAVVQNELYTLEEIRSPWRNPMYYAKPLDLLGYVLRDYRPVLERAQAVIAIAEAAPDFLARARRNLVPRMPRSWLRVARLQMRGLQESLPDVRRGLHPLPPKLAHRLERALEKMRRALTLQWTFLVRCRRVATDDFALGPQHFARMLDETQGIAIPLARLERIGREELRRNTLALQEAARRVDATKSVAEVVAMVRADRPSLGEIFELARQQGRALKRFVRQRGIVTIPCAARAYVRPTPPFMRRNLAFLDAVGPFEEKLLPSFFYISPPNPRWSAEAQRSYLPSRLGLLLIATHELWPGHLLDRLHRKQQASPILKSFGSLVRSEGWAHYVEEMMLEQGLGEGDAKLRVMQLVSALFRNVRFLVAIGLHARGMTMQQAAALFVTHAFATPERAREQARRGTFAPMFLSYTLGKLIVRKLRDDYRKKLGSRYTLRKFHDAFLGCCGAAPLPVIRRTLLGADAGPIL